MHLSTYLGLLHDAERTLAESLRRVADGHAAEADVHHIGAALAQECDDHVQQLVPLTARYGERRDDEPERLEAQGLSELRSGPVGLLRDLQDLYLLASFVAITWDVVGQAGQAARDADVLGVVNACQPQSRVHISWLRTRIEQAAPQALIAA